MTSRSQKADRIVFGVNKKNCDDLLNILDSLQNSKESEHSD